MIDIAGFRVCRTHITLRKRNAKRCIRCMTRAFSEFIQNGSIKHQQANSVISRNGMMRVANSYRLMEKYHLRILMRLARRVQSYWSKYENQKRERGMRSVLERYRRYCKTGFGIDVCLA